MSGENREEKPRRWDFFFRVEPRFEPRLRLFGIGGVDAAWEGLESVVSSLFVFALSGDGTGESSMGLSCLARSSWRMVFGPV